MSALRDAIKAVKSDIVTVPFQPKPKRKPEVKKPVEVVPLRPKQYVNGYEVKWVSQDNGPKIPYIQTDRFYVQYPTKGEDIKLPEGTVRASYNKGKKRVEFFGPSTGFGQPTEPIRYVNDAKHDPLPLPRYFNDLERVEEIFEIDFETGEVISDMRVDVLPEGVHWKLRLQEFEAQCVRGNLNPKAISFRLQKHLKNLEATRGVTVEQLAAPIPQTILDAIEFAETKQRVAGGK